MVVGVIVFALVVIFSPRAHARDAGQWEGSNHEIRQWFESLMQPDQPTISCCGEADAYWADKIQVEGEKVFAIITDDRPDGPLRRPHIPVGTKIEVPPWKLKFDRGNPSGHAVIFLSTTRQVYCFVQSSGI
ncbi:MAG: hypothetical protein B7Y77_01730 [Bradyrhizobium sp. 35-63-5]|nr:MAG: hypothetical protein B7Y77_01730 [Bradyrhizobium sp. 35-63-5]